jgi:hypothetical protein
MKHQSQFIAIPFVLFAACLCWPEIQSAHAQAAQNSWDNLRQLRVDQKIAVIDMNLRSLRGNFIGYSEQGLSLHTEQGQNSIQRDQVFRVSDLETSHRLRNILLGLAIGTAGGAVTGAIAGKSYHEEGETSVFMLVFTPIGAGAGAGVGAALPAGHKTIYRAKNRNPSVR